MNERVSPLIKEAEGQNPGEEKHQWYLPTAIAHKVIATTEATLRQSRNGDQRYTDPHTSMMNTTKMQAPPLPIQKSVKGEDEKPGE